MARTSLNSLYPSSHRRPLSRTHSRLVISDAVEFFESNSHDGFGDEVIIESISDDGNETIEMAPETQQLTLPPKTKAQQLRLPPETQQLTMALEPQQLTMAPETQQLTMALETQHVTMAPETQQLTMALETQQLTMAPETQQLTMAPETQQLTLPPKTQQLAMPPAEEEEKSDSPNPAPPVARAKASQPESFSNYRLRRDKANMNEKRRMKSINLGFQSLASAIQNVELPPKASKVETLQCAVRSIETLKGEVETLTALLEQKNLELTHHRNPVTIMAEIASIAIPSPQGMVSIFPISTQNFADGVQMNDHSKQVIDTSSIPTNASEPIPAIVMPDPGPNSSEMDTDVLSTKRKRTVSASTSTETDFDSSYIDGTKKGKRARTQPGKGIIIIEHKHGIPEKYIQNDSELKSLRRKVKLLESRLNHERNKRIRVENELHMTNIRLWFDRIGAKGVTEMGKKYGFNDTDNDIDKSQVPSKLGSSPSYSTLFANKIVPQMSGNGPISNDGSLHSIIQALQHLERSQSLMPMSNTAIAFPTSSEPPINNATPRKMTMPTATHKIILPSPVKATTSVNAKTQFILTTPVKTQMKVTSRKNKTKLITAASSAVQGITEIMVTTPMKTRFLAQQETTPGSSSSSTRTPELPTPKSYTSKKMKALTALIKQ